MNIEELSVKVTEVDARSKSNTHRIDKIEENQEAINKIATSVAVMAENQTHMSQQMDRLDKKVDGVSDKVDTIEKLPAKRWETVVEKVITVVAAAIVGYILARIGMSA